MTVISRGSKKKKSVFLLCEMALCAFLFLSVRLYEHQIMSGSRPSWAVLLGGQEEPLEEPQGP